MISNAIVIVDEAVMHSARLHSYDVSDLSHVLFAPRRAESAAVWEYRGVRHSNTVNVVAAPLIHRNAEAINRRHFAAQLRVLLIQRQILHQKVDALQSQIIIQMRTPKTVIGHT